MLQIIKRDGRKVDFESDKIENAVLKAFKAVDGEITPYATDKAASIANYITEKVRSSEQQFTVENIQDMVCHGMMNLKNKAYADAYIAYRAERTRERNKNEAITKLIETKIMASDVQNQNANVDERSFGGRRGEAMNEYMKQYALDYIVTEKTRENHLKNMVYTHDLNKSGSLI